MTSPSDRHDFSPKESGRTGVTIVSLFRSHSEAEAAIRELKSAGFTDEEIGVVMQDVGQRSADPDTTESTSGSAAAVGGGLVGGLIGLLGSLLIPGIGPLLLGGVLAATLTGAGIGAVTGGLIGILAELGVSAPDAEYFERGLRGGGILLTVNAGQRTSEALAIIGNHGADLGPKNRRIRDDPGYSGPERRLARV